MSTNVRIEVPPVEEVRWGDVCYVDVPDDIAGSEQSGIRPALIVQNDKGNEHSPTTIVALITSRKKKWIPTHITVFPKESGLNKISTVMFEQIRTIDKTRIISKVGHLNTEWLTEQVRKSILISFGI
jgi:mRNA interferase MazF